jgi:hypothetical protein
MTIPPCEKLRYFLLPRMPPGPHYPPPAATLQSSASPDYSRCLFLSPFNAAMNRSPAI